MKCIFELSFSVLLVRRPTSVVIFTKPSKRTTKTKKTVKSENKNMKNETNLNSLKSTLTTYDRGTYNVLHPKTQNGTKPNKANSKKGKPRLSGSTQAKNFFMESKANFPNSRPILTHETKGTYSNSRPQNHKKSKPNPKPIQSQSKANFTHLFHGENICKNLQPKNTTKNTHGLFHFIAPYSFCIQTSSLRYSSKRYRPRWFLWFCWLRSISFSMSNLLGCRSH